LYFFVAGVYLTSSMYGLLPPMIALLSQHYNFLFEAEQLASPSVLL
jgi:hypothetical protein